MMKKIFGYIFLFAILLCSCEKDKEEDKVILAECNFENPMEELDWLNNVKNSFTNCTCQISILQGIYKEKTVFYVMVTDPLCNSSFYVTLWDCNGDVVKEYKPGDNDIFYSEVELVKNVYTCAE